MKISKTTTAIMVFTILGFYCIFTQCESKPPINNVAVQPNIEAVLQFLKEEDYTNNLSWHLYPDTDVSPDSDTLKRLGLPVHGRWVRSYVNQIAFDYLKVAMDSSTAQPLEFPPGSFIVKENYRSSFDTLKNISPDRRELGAITLLYKPDPKFDYCVTAHLEPYNGEDCYGGDWFYGFFFYQDLVNGKISKKSKKIQNNVNSFCVGCHSPAFSTDYVRMLGEKRNPFAQKSSSDYCDRFDSSTPKEAKLIAAEEPDDLQGFTNQIEEYIQNASLSPDMPSDVPADPLLVFKFLGPEATQSMFDSYAWKSFIALNWPNKGLNSTTQKPQRGEADKKLPFQDNVEKATVWETFKPTFEVFQPGNIKWNPVNQPWNQSPRTPVGLNCVNDEDDLVLTMQSKNRDVVNETGQAFAGTFGFLVDQDSQKVRYEVLFNRTEFDYLVSNDRAASVNLTPSGPKDEINKVNFPDTRDDKKYNQGAMEIKSAWKELCLTADCNHRDAENLEAAKKKFLVRNTVIYNADSTSCRRANMGLVGLHIARKTYYAPQWIWITFEHKDNVPDAGQENPKGTFYNPDLKEADDCFQLPFLVSERNKPEVITCPNVDLNRFTPGFANQPNQLTRLVPIDKEAQQLNVAFQKELEKINSPFANYVLVNAQWPLNGRQQNGQVSKLNCKDNGMGADCFTTVPRFLRNTVIESYMSTYCNISGKAQQVSNRSCLSCHGTAGADLSYIWLDAVSQRVQVTD